MLFPLLLCMLVLYVPPAAGAPEASWPFVASGVVGLVLLNAAAAWVGSGLALRLSHSVLPHRALAANRIFAFLKGCVVGFVLADVFVIGWPALVDGLVGYQWWAVFVHDAVLLMPALVMVLTVMAFQHRFEYRQGRVSLPLWPYMWLRFRVEMAVVLVPWLALVLVVGATALLFGGSELADALASGIVVVLVVVFSPFLLRVVWATSRLAAGPLRERLEAFCRSQRFRCHEILVWHTYRHMANAGVVGPTPLVRYVMLSDALLQNCTDEEVEAVFAHEVGHVRHRHLALYLLFGLGFVSFYANLMDLVALAGRVQPLQSMLAFDMTSGQAAIMLLFAAFYWGIVFGFLSRRMEQQADLFAVQSVADPGAFASALGKLAAMGTAPGGVSFWRHFSIPRRLAFLERVLREPSRARRFELKITAMRVGLVVALILCTARLLIARPELFAL